VDLVVCGSVAVNRSGVRLGKGGGYADLELALLVEAGLVSNQNRDRDDVHASQVVDERLPETDLEMRVYQSGNADRAAERWKRIPEEPAWATCSRWRGRRRWSPGGAGGSG
jgi:5-formyltetrahydrofolate cyclo-ligase